MLTMQWNAEKIVKPLIEAGADLNAQDNEGKTALMIARQRLAMGIARLLITEGADRRHAADDIADAIIAAAKTNDVNKASSIIYYDFPVDDVQDDDGWTALMWAAHTNSVDVVKLLIAAGADVNAKDKRGAPVLRYAEENDAADVIELLKAAGAETEK